MIQKLGNERLTNLARPIGRVTHRVRLAGRVRGGTQSARTCVPLDPGARCELPRQIYRTENKWIPGTPVQ